MFMILSRLSPCIMMTPSFSEPPIPSVVLIFFEISFFGNWLEFALFSTTFYSFYLLPAHYFCLFWFNQFCWLELVKLSRIRTRLLNFIASLFLYLIFLYLNGFLSFILSLSISVCLFLSSSFFILSHSLPLLSFPINLT